MVSILHAGKGPNTTQTQSLKLMRKDQHYQELGPPREEISITYQNTVLQ